MPESTTTELDDALVERGLIVVEYSRSICAAARVAVQAAQAARVKAEQTRQRCAELRAQSRDGRRPPDAATGAP